MILNYYRLNLLNNFYNLLLHILISLALNSRVIEQHAKEIHCYINNRRVTEYSVGYKAFNCCVLSVSCC